MMICFGKCEVEENGNLLKNSMQIWFIGSKILDMDIDLFGWYDISNLRIHCIILHQ